MPDQVHPPGISGARTKIIIFDKDPGILSRLTSSMSPLADVEIVGQTSDLSKLEELFGIARPDAAVMRLTPQTKELQIVQAAKAINPQVTLIVLSNNPSIIYHKEWKKAGVDFYFNTAEAVDFLPDFFAWKVRTYHGDSLARAR